VSHSPTECSESTCESVAALQLFERPDHRCTEPPFAPNQPHCDQRFAALTNFGTTKCWRSKSTLYEAGVPAQVLYRIKKGAVAEFQMLRDGRRHIVAIRMAGDFCGGVTATGRNDFSAKALTDVEAQAIAGQKLAPLLNSEPHLAAALAEDLMHRLKEACERIVVVARLNAEQRVAHLLLELRQRYRLRGLNPDALPLPLSRQEMADYLGMNLETVCRAMAKMKRQGLIKIDSRHEIRIWDERGVSALAAQM
jgi:CRP-like cAMP-binding protein